MSRTRDELAGVVDLFGALTREELADALAELAFKRGQEVDRETFDAEIEGALEDYYLVAYEPDDADGTARTDGDEPLLVPGPVAFPTLTEYAPDLPHIMDVPDPGVDRDALGEQVADRLREEVEAVAESGDADRAGTLLDVTYDAEAWASMDLSDARERLAGVVEE
jgi:hypothetical protein